MEQIQCGKCGKTTDLDSNFCINCGNKIKVEHKRNEALYQYYLEREMKKSKFLKWLPLILICIFAIAFFIIMQIKPMKPLGIRKQVYDLGVEAVNITDSLLSGKIDCNEAYERINNVYNIIQSVASDTEPKELKIKSTILLLNVRISSYNIHFTLTNKADISDIVESRNDLASQLGLSEY